MPVNKNQQIYVSPALLMLLKIPGEWFAATVLVEKRRLTGTDYTLPALGSVYN